MLQALRTALLVTGLMAVAPTLVRAAEPAHAVGVRQVEFVTPTDRRPLSLVVFYPAAMADPAAPRLQLPFTINLDLLADAPFLQDGTRRPLVMLSHGRGSDAWQYAWLAQALASQGFIVAGLNHYRANTYQREIGWLANRIWQRPVNLGLGISHLLGESAWSPHIDPERIGVTGHSQGGFTGRCQVGD